MADFLIVSSVDTIHQGNLFSPGLRPLKPPVKKVHPPNFTPKKLKIGDRFAEIARCY